MKTYNAMFMTFDGEHKIEGEFPTIDKAWEYINNAGSRWYFYPFCFVVTPKTIIASTEQLDCLTTGKRIKTIADIFKKHSELPETADMEPDEFIFHLLTQHVA